MINSLWPKRLTSPDIELGIPIEEGLKILQKLGSPKETHDKKEHSYRVDCKDFSVAIYEDRGVVKSVWYDDPIGRLWSKGKAMKLRLYLSRYGDPEDWEFRMDNGWMHYHFNDNAGLMMVYGVQKDVIRFNLQD